MDRESDLLRDVDLIQQELLFSYAYDYVGTIVKQGCAQINCFAMYLKEVNFNALLPCFLHNSLISSV